MKVSNNHQSTSFKSLKLGQLSSYARDNVIKPSLPYLKTLAKKADIKLDSGIISTSQIGRGGAPAIHYEITYNNFFMRMFNIPPKQKKGALCVSDQSWKTFPLRIEQIMKQIGIIK